MDEFRSMKLVRKDKDKLVAVNIEVNFDKTKHLSDASIKRRKVIRERLMEKDRQKAEEEEKKLRIEQEKREKEKQKEEVRKQIQAERRRQREERRKQKNIQKITQSESSELTKKIHKEQRKLLKVQRKMESIRLLEALFERLKSKFPADDSDHGPTKGFKGFDLRKKLKKKKSKTDHERSKSVSSNSSNESKKKSKKRRDSSASSASSTASTSDESTDHRHKSKSTSLVPGPPNGMFPTTGWMPNPETGEWFPASNFMYPFFPGMVRPYFNSNYRGSYPRRGRGRGRGYYGNDGRYLTLSVPIYRFIETYCKLYCQSDITDATMMITITNMTKDVPTRDLREDVHILEAKGNLFRILNNSTVVNIFRPQQSHTVTPA